MDPRMRDYMMRRDQNISRMGPDGRNPYGSRGGYVTSRQPDRRAGRSYDRKSNYNDSYNGMGDRASGYNGRMTGYGYNRYPIEEDYMDDYDMDFGGGYLSKDELREWKHKLYEEMEKSEYDMLSDDNIFKRAKDLGIKFDSFTESEFIVTTLMMYTDYCKTLGKANMDVYLKLAKDFLDDKDAGLKFGEKLAAYYDNVVNV